MTNAIKLVANYAMVVKLATNYAMVVCWVSP